MAAPLPRNPPTDTPTDDPNGDARPPCTAWGAPRAGDGEEGCCCADDTVAVDRIAPLRTWPVWRLATVRRPAAARRSCASAAMAHTASARPRSHGLMPPPNERSASCAVVGRVSARALLMGVKRVSARPHTNTRICTCSMHMQHAACSVHGTPAGSSTHTHTHTHIHTHTHTHTHMTRPDQTRSDQIRPDQERERPRHGGTTAASQPVNGATNATQHNTTQHNPTQNPHRPTTQQNALEQLRRTP